MTPTEAAAFCLASWFVGALWGGYRYERIWRDRTLRQIVRDYRGRRSR